MKFILLTHQRELHKSTNTGSLVVDVLGAAAEIIVWNRTYPLPKLTDYIDAGSTALLYPSDDSQCMDSSTVFERYIIIDGTWQEAAKIHNRSPYLHTIPKVKLRVIEPSAYNMRRNQRAGCLCTAECAMVALLAMGADKKANELHAAFSQFLEK